MANFDDILFADRNRAYGAYALRQGYRTTLGRAMVLGTLLFLGALQLPTIYGWVKPDSNPVMIEATLEDVNLDTPPDEEIALPPKEEIAPTVATVKNLVPEVVADAPDEDPPIATVEELEVATSGPTTQEGTGDVEIIAPPEAVAPTVVEKALEVTEPANDKPFVVVEQQPDFPGGQSALREFLQRNLQYPSAASRANVSGRVYASFVVNTDGTLVDVQILKGIGYGCDEEAMRVIKAMPRWKAGRQSGRAVRVKYNLPITFTLEN